MGTGIVLLVGASALLIAAALVESAWTGAIRTGIPVSENISANIQIRNIILLFIFLRYSNEHT